MVEKEPFQLEYERYAINRSLKKIGKRYGLKSVLEVPAAGLKAMPSLYSLGFGEAGCEVILVNPEERGIKIWRDLKLNAREVRADDLAHLPLEENSVDLVWNFNTLSLYKNYEEILKELIRVSRKYVMILCVNGYNVGSPIHRGLHRMMKVAWTHGEKLFLFPKNVKRLLEKANLGVVEVGVMNCPPWPDTVGFRDMKFHRMEKEGKGVEWEVGTVKYMQEKKYPLWIRLVYLLEVAPLPRFLKYPYAHLFYVIGKKR